jgi:hypothetical protein
MGFFKDLTRGLFGSNQPVKDAARFNEEQGRRAEQVLDDGLTRVDQYYRDMDQRYADLFKGVIERIDAGYTMAEDRVRGSNRSAKQGAFDRGQQTAADVTQTMLSRGLTNSSQAANLQRGVRADTSRELTAIDSQEGQQLASLAQQGTNAAASAMQTIGGARAMVPERALQAQLNTRAALAQTIMSLQAQAQPTQGLLGGVAGAAGGVGQLAGGLGQLASGGGILSLLG